MLKILGEYQSTYGKVYDILISKKGHKKYVPVDSILSVTFYIFFF